MYSSKQCRDRYSMNAMVLLPYSLLFRQRIPALLSFSDISKLSPLGRPFSPPYEIVSISTMIVNAYPRDLVPQREYFLQFDPKQDSPIFGGGEIRSDARGWWNFLE